MRPYRMELYSMLYGDLNGKEIQKQWGYMYDWFTCLVVQQKLTQKCKATILKFKKEKKKKKKKKKKTQNLTSSSLTN